MLQKSSYNSAMPRTALNLISSFQTSSSKQQLSGSRSYQFNLPTQSSDVRHWKDRSKASTSEHQQQQMRENPPRRKKRSGAERIRAPPLPQQQHHQHPHNEDDDKFWQIYRSESKPLKYPKECINFRFGPLSEYGKERGDNFIRYATVKLLFLK